MITISAEVLLKDRQSGSTCRAQVLRNPDPSVIAQQQMEWNKYKETAMSSGVIKPDHHLWNWQEKVRKHPSPANTLYALRFQEQIQGCLLLSTAPQTGRLNGFPLLYVEYLESAPWNLSHYAGGLAKYGRVGFSLLDIAGEASIAAGCSGRLGLHTLKDAASFYETYGFQNLGPDPDEGLDYLELGEYPLQ
jgi:hypothetical protein